VVVRGVLGEELGRGGEGMCPSIRQVDIKEKEENEAEKD